jgi:hypothetical protein
VCAAEGIDDEPEAGLSVAVRQVQDRGLRRIPADEQALSGEGHAVARACSAPQRRVARRRVAHLHDRVTLRDHVVDVDLGAVVYRNADDAAPTAVGWRSPCGSCRWARGY